MAKKLEVKTKYSEYLKSPEWKELRSKVYERAGDRCELCGHIAWAVHHIEYPKNLEEDKLSNLLVVCELCHDKLHGKRLGIIPKGELTKAMLSRYIKMEKGLRQQWGDIEGRISEIDSLTSELEDIDSDLQHTKVFLLLRKELDVLMNFQRFIENTGALKVGE